MKRQFRQKKKILIVESNKMLMYEMNEFYPHKKKYLTENKLLMKSTNNLSLKHVICITAWQNNFSIQLTIILLLESYLHKFCQIKTFTFLASP